MRSTASTGTAPLAPHAETGNTRRSAATSGGERTGRTTGNGGGVSRPSSLGDVAGREKQSRSEDRPRHGVGTGGWAEYNKQRAERSSAYPRLEIKNDPVLIKFAEAEPFAFIYRHWVAKRPFTCIGEDCPLCEAGDRAKPVVFYNVITMADCVLRVWELSSDPTRKVQKHYERLAASDKTLADADLYWLISKSQRERSSFDYDVEKVKADDLDEYNTEPLTADEYAEATKRGLFTDEVIRTSSKSDLREAVDDLED